MLCKHGDKCTSDLARISRIYIIYVSVCASCDLHIIESLLHDGE